MNKFFFYCISILVVFFSCSQKKDKNVVNFEVISEQQMKNILYDLHMHDGIINAYNNQSKSNIFLSEEHYESQIFKKYNCTDTLFKLNLEYYTMEGKIRDIYSSVIDSMNVLKVKLEQHKVKKSRFSRRYQIEKH